MHSSVERHYFIHAFVVDAVALLLSIKFRFLRINYIFVKSSAKPGGNEQQDRKSHGLLSLKVWQSWACVLMHARPFTCIASASGF